MLVILPEGKQSVYEVSLEEQAVALFIFKIKHPLQIHLHQTRTEKKPFSPVECTYCMCAYVPTCWTVVVYAVQRSHGKLF